MTDSKRLRVDFKFWLETSPYSRWIRPLKSETSCIINDLTYLEMHDASLLESQRPASFVLASRFNILLLIPSSHRTLTDTDICVDTIRSKIRMLIEYEINVYRAWLNIWRCTQTRVRAWNYSDINIWLLIQYFKDPTGNINNATIYTCPVLRHVRRSRHNDLITDECAEIPKQPVEGQNMKSPLPVVVCQSITGTYGGRKITMSTGSIHSDL